jgi:hypothetical protein
MAQDRMEKYLQALAGGEKSGAVERGRRVVNSVDLKPKNALNTLRFTLYAKKVGAHARRIEGRRWINLILVSWKCYMLSCLNLLHFTPHDLRFTEVNQY